MSANNRKMGQKYVGNDPDPSEYLIVSLEQKKYDQSKPYDAKRSCWVPDDKEGFVMGEIKGAKGDLITVQLGYKESQFKKDLVAQVNPPKFEKCEDMSDLTYLNDASVLHNLKSRYFAKLIYTYSGLFCVAINPYKRYPIYTERVVRLFEGKRRTEVPPHIFAISDNAYRDMLLNDQNQSILITGESGAGKTENTKKVIYYFSVVGSNSQESKASTDAPLEQQIIRTNPILESFGNAKTVRNDNSSRFGKFIRIHFNIKGKIAGADIETYLLEKARVVSQQHNERSYHIFYQIMSGAIPGLLDSLLLSPNMADYNLQSMGTTVIDGVNDKEEMLLTDSSMDILGFSSTDKLDTYKIVSTVMHLGNMKFKQRGREEQAEADGEENGETVCRLLGMSSDELYDNLLRPKIKVGTEFVTQGRNKKQVCYSVAALSKAIFDRLFKWLVSKCNETMETQMKKNHFIGVLDIAGFEIFEFNSFEQLCINFTNEKLQQFFNHHMFVLEQEEYQREGISWTFIDFGLDLQACIDLIEKPLGIFSILEEESMFPKATNKSFEEKLVNNHMGKTPNFVRPKQTGHGKGASLAHDPDEDPNPHFGIIHYAGTVPYNVNGWLEKNKDPLNECVVEQIKTAKSKLASELFKDMAGEHKQTKRARGSAFQTVSALYREQVQNLMQTLQATSPHFIRCIIPNEKKDPNKIDALLVMQQLTCNGVLEGIRICRKGFPNRMFYKDFKERYLVLASKPMLAMGNDTKSAAKICFDKIQLEDDKYRLGTTKVFFRSGVLGYMEELRSAKLSEMISYLQAACRGYLGKLKIHEYMIRKKALPVVQRAIRNFMKIRPWMWYRLFKTIRPMLEMGVSEDIIKEMKDKLDAQRLAMDEEEKRIQEVEEELERSAAEKQKLLDEMEQQKKLLEDIKAKEEELREAAKRREKEIQEALRKAEEEEAAKYEAEQAKKRAQMEIRKIKEELEDLKQSLAKSGQDRDSKSQQLHALKDELERQNEQMSRLNKEKKDLYNQNLATKEELESTEEKNRHLEKVKRQMEAEMDEMENSLQKEKDAKQALERAKRKAEEDLKKFMADMADQEDAQKSLMAMNQKKEKEMAALLAKIEDNEANCAKHQKMMRERAMRIDDLEDELEAEQKYRSQAEKRRRDLQAEMDDLRLKLEEAGDQSAVQAEFNRKRDSEVSSLRKDLEEARIKQEAALAIARKKYDGTLRSQQEELDNHRRHQIKLEKDKIELENRAKEAEVEADRARIEKAQMERDYKRDRSMLLDLKAQLDEANRNAFDFEHVKDRMDKENGDLLRRLEEADNQIGQLNTNKSSLMNQLNDAKRLSDFDMKERSNIMSKYKQMEREHDSMKTSMEDEIQAKEDLKRQLAQLNGELQSWRNKYNNETVPKLEDMENAKMKLQLRLTEAQDTIEGLNAKCISLEKSKQRIAMELDDVQAQFDVSSRRCSELEKQSKNFDKAMDEWKRKIEELKESLSQSEKQNRIYHGELSSVKAQNSKLREDNESSNLEVKRLGEEIKELLAQIGDGGRTFRELQNQKRVITLERDEFGAALKEAEEALFCEENKVLRALAEKKQLKADIESQMREKEIEFEEGKKGLLSLIASLQASLEAEQKAKIEIQRLKKRLESDIRELELALDHANHSNREIHLNLKRINVQNAELQHLLEEEKRSKEEVRERLFVVERKSNALQNDLEKSQTTLEQTERGFKQMEMELRDKKGELHSESLRCNGLLQMKRKLEAEIVSLRADLVDCNSCLKDSHAKCRKAFTDVMELSDDLKYMTERVNTEESLRRGLESQLKEMVIHLEELEGSSLRGGKKLVNKLEERIRALERDLDNEERLRIDAIKEKRKSDRKIKDYEVILEEKDRNCQRFTEMVSPLQAKMKLLKQQVEDAEEIAALNLAKYKKAIGEAEDSEKRAYVAEQAVTRLRAKSSGGLYF